MKLTFSLLFFGSFLSFSFGQSNQTSNWTATDKKHFKSECLRGIQQSFPNLTYQQKNNYCDCVTEKIVRAFPNKHSQQDMEVMMKIARECSRLHL